MAIRHAQMDCTTCGKKTRSMQEVPHDITHLVLSVLTVGLWLPIWLLLATFPPRPVCSVCGEKKALTQPEKDGWTMALITLGIGAVLFLGFWLQSVSK